MHIIIDGYNLIRQSPTLRSKERISIEAGRDNLIKLLADFRKIRPHRITCVFDGRTGTSVRETRELKSGIEVIYSAIGDTADDVIKRMAQREAGNLLVVTSDREIANYVHRRGGVAVSSPEFEDRLLMSVSGITFPPEKADDGEKEEEPVRGTTKKGPSRRPSRSKKRLRQSLGKL